MTEAEWSRLNAGIHWLRAGDRARYRELLVDVRRGGGNVDAFNADVKQAAENGLIVTEEREPA